MTSSATVSVVPSIPPNPELLTSAARLLCEIEELPPDATGVLHFGTDGLILVESRRICWAVAAGMKRRLGELLRQQRSPPLEWSYIEQVVRQCQLTGRPLDQALLATGEVSEEGLRSALFSHTTEAIAHIAVSRTPCAGLQPHDAGGYDPRFVFSTAEVLVALGAHRNRATAVAASLDLRSALVSDARGLAFLRDDCGPTAIAVAGTPVLRVSEMLELCGWSCGLFDVASFFDEGVRAATRALTDPQAVVTWRRAETHFVAVCNNRAAAALLLARADTALGASSEAHT